MSLRRARRIREQCIRAQADVIDPFAAFSEECVNRVPVPVEHPSAGDASESWPYDGERLARMLANEADMSFPRRADAVYDFLRIGPRHRVLDMGCGRGFYLKFTRELYPEADVVGVELDTPLLDRARSAVPGVRVLSADVRALPFADGAFDRIVFTEVIEHIADDAAALRELARVCAPGGVMALTTPNADYPLAWDPINRVLEVVGAQPIRTGLLSGIWANHERLYEPEQLARLAADSGWIVEEARAFTHYSMPFIHNLVYGLGKELLEAGALPPSMAAAADRFNTDGNEGSGLNPVRIGLRTLRAFDRLNDHRPPTFDQSYLITALKLRKPTETNA